MTTSARLWFVTDPWTLITNDDARRLTVAAGEVVVRLPGSVTAGALSIVEFDLPAHAVGAAAHVHQAHDEGFLVLSGRVQFVLGGSGPAMSDGEVAAPVEREVVAGESALAWIPRGVRHGFANPDDTPTKLLGFFSPSGYETYFVEMAEAISRGEVFDSDALAALRAKYATVTG